jgi:hypothetical protein
MRVKTTTVFVLSALLIGALLIQTGIVLAFFTDFESFALGGTSESLILPGVTLGSPFSPGDWTVQDNTGDYVLLSGHILKGTVCTSALIMNFDDLQSGLTFNFGADPSVAVVKVDVWTGNPTPGVGIMHASYSYYGVNLGSPTGKLEGSVAFSGYDFDTVVLYAPGGCLAIDDLGTPTTSFPGRPGRDMVPLPPTAAVGTFIETTPAYYLPHPDAVSDAIFEAGKSVWVLGVDESGEFYQVVFSGSYLWVPVDTIGPNYDEVWQGHPLPEDVVE